MNRKVVILGGYGAFGSKVAANLAQEPTISLVIAGRNRQKGTAFASSLGATFTFCDLKDVSSIHRLVSNAFLLIHAAGPFSGAEHSVARVCLEHGVHYLDIGDEREHVTSISVLNKEAERRDLFLCAGASTTPGLTSAMVRKLAADRVHIHAIHSALSPGNKNPRGASTVATVLGYLGRPIPMTIDNKVVDRTGWSDGEVVAFPAPVGRRRVYTVDTPDLALFPAYFRAQTVTFKAGLELNVMNHSLAAMSKIQQRLGRKNLVRLAKPFTNMSWLLYPLGSPYGAAAVWIEGQKKGKRIQRSLAIVAPVEGPLVAAAPSVILARQLLDGRLTQRGAFPCLGLFEFDELMSFLGEFGIWAVQGDEHGWMK